MDRHERVTRRDSFLEQGEDYALARPGYPEALLVAGVRAGGLREDSRVLDVGCGTGQATSWFLDRGHEVLAIDRSPEMLRLARVHLGARDRLELREVDFEADESLGVFDATVLATSYHWLDPATRAIRCAASLVPGGALFLLWHTHPVPYTGYFEESQAIYRKYVPGWAPPPTPGAREEDIRGIEVELETSGVFDTVERFTEDWSRVYERDLYLRLLNTYSDHRLLESDTRERLFGELAVLIDRSYGGRVERPYRSELVLGVRRAGG